MLSNWKKIIIVLLLSIFLIYIYSQESFLGASFYADLFFIPIILTGFWFYRYSIFVAILFAMYSIIFDFIELGEILNDKFIRGLIYISVAVLMYYFNKKIIEKSNKIERISNDLTIEKDWINTMLLSIGDGVVSIDLSGNIVFLNEESKKYLGSPIENVIGKSFSDVFNLMIEGDLKNSDNLLKTIVGNEQFKKLEVDAILKTEEKEDRFFSINARTIFDTAWNRNGVILIFHDITKQKEIISKMKSSEEGYNLLAENISDVISVFNITKNKFVYISPSIMSLRGFTVEEAMNERLEDGLLPEVHAQMQKDLEDNVNEFLRNPNIKKRYISQRKQICKNGDLIWVELAIRFHFNDEGDILSTALIRNIDDRKKAEELLLFNSNNDQLTGLYNRRFYEDEIKRLDTERNFPLTIVLGDVNDLKRTNDLFGHAKGDDLLKEVGNILREACRADDLIVRYGGDEFVIILPKTDSNETDKIINRINNLAANKEVENIQVSISFGFASKEDANQNIEDIFKNAEALMYKNKQESSSNNR